MLTVKIKDEDLGWEKIQSELKKLNERKSEIGYYQSGGGSGIGLAHLATIQEFGVKIPVTKKMRGFLWWKGFNAPKVITIPERPSMRRSFDNNINNIKKLGFELAGKVIDLAIGAKTAYEAWGDFYKSELQKGITSKSLNLKANHPFTVEMKGSDTPLVDTGRLVNGSEVKVTRK